MSARALVPVEPTDDMLVAGQEAWLHKRRSRPAMEDCEEAGELYRAMLSATPTPAQEISDEEIAEIYRTTFNGMPGAVREAPKPLPAVYAFARALLARRSESVRDGALEEAALIADKREPRCSRKEQQALCRLIAAAIRSLKGQRP